MLHKRLWPDRDNWHRRHKLWPTPRAPTTDHRAGSKRAGDCPTIVVIALPMSATVVGALIPIMPTAPASDSSSRHQHRYKKHRKTFHFHSNLEAGMGVEPTIYGL